MLLFNILHYVTIVAVNSIVFFYSDTILQHYHKVVVYSTNEWSALVDLTSSVILIKKKQTPLPECISCIAIFIFKFSQQQPQPSQLNIVSHTQIIKSVILILYILSASYVKPLIVFYFLFSSVNCIANKDW